MRETIISYVDGDKLDNETVPCVFCSKIINCRLIGIISKNKRGEFLLKSFSVCNEHFDKLNAILSGEFDIDTIVLNKHVRMKNSINMRTR